MLNSPAWMEWPETHTLLAGFERAEIEVRFVGGCVRDALLGREIRDIDIATATPPEEVMRLLHISTIRTIPTGIGHGTVTAVVDKRPFEITTLRKDHACDGRHAKVEFTDDWQEDAARRDFTMNALYATPRGDVFDYFGGVHDAQAGHVRFIGDAAKRIEEDYLRILRFFRFFALYGNGRPDEDAVIACAEAAGHLSTLSGERIQQEMLKLLSAPDPSETLHTMDGAGVLKRVLDVSYPQEAMLVLPRLEAQDKIVPEAARRMALLIRGAGGYAESCLQMVSGRWKLSTALHERLRLLVSLPTIEPMLPDHACKQVIRAQGNEMFRDRVLIAWAEQGMDYEDVAKPYHDMILLSRRWTPPEFPLSGDDLMALGMKPGPALGAKLKELEAYWEAEHYEPDAAELLNYYKRQSA